MKRLGFAFFWTGAATVALLAACNGSSGPADVGPLNNFLQAQAQASCDWEFKCCTDAEIKTIDDGKYATDSSCVAYQQLSQEDSLYLARLAVSEGRLRVDSTHAAACLKELSARPCNALTPTVPTVPPTTTVPDDCALAVVGNTAVGDECIYATECVTGAHCVNDTTVVGRGVCVPYQEVGAICNADADCDPSVTNIYCAQQDFKCHLRGEAGAACAYTLAANGTTPTLPLLLECDDSPTSGLYCDPTTSTCKTLPGDGQPCLSPLPPGITDACNPDPTLELTCAGTLGTGTSGGTCKAPGKVGDNCATLPCAAGLYCNITSAGTGTTEVCATLPTLGQPCAGPEQQCAKPYYCKFNATTDVSTCTQPAELNQDCSAVTCDTGLYCASTGTGEACAAQLPDGSPCEEALPGQCLSLFCSGTPSICQPTQTGIMCVGR